jgi:hypothetical protein
MNEEWLRSVKMKIGGRPYRSTVRAPRTPQPHYYLEVLCSTWWHATSRYKLVEEWGFLIARNLYSMRMYEKTPGMLTLALTSPLRLFRPVDGNLSRTVDETKQTISDPTSYYRILYACWEHSTFRYCTRTER